MYIVWIFSYLFVLLAGCNATVYYLTKFNKNLEEVTSTLTAQPYDYEAEEVFETPHPHERFTQSA